MVKQTWLSYQMATSNNWAKKENYMIVLDDKEQDNDKQRAQKKSNTNFDLHPFNWTKELASYNLMAKNSMEYISDQPMPKHYMQPVIEDHLFLMRKLQYMDWIWQEANVEGMIINIHFFEIAQEI